MRRDLQARERRTGELEAALAALRDRSSATESQLAASRHRIRELEVCQPPLLTHLWPRPFSICHVVGLAQWPCCGA